jgi:hypothetical protein
MPAVARKSGADTIATGHGCDTTTVTLEGSNNVFVNNIGIVRKGDLAQVHTYEVEHTREVEDPPPDPPVPDDYVPSTHTEYYTTCDPHQFALTSYSGNVFANNLNIGRLGDTYGREALSSGSPNVFANS